MTVTPSPAINPDEVVRQVRALGDDELHNLAEVVRQVQIERAIDNGDHDAIVAAAFEVGFGRDGLGVLPWVEGSVVVCPGGLVSKSKTSHRCRFVSVDDVWVWDSGLLLREDKRSAPGTEEGFRAIALVPVVDGTELDVVTGKARRAALGRSRDQLRDPQGPAGRGQPTQRRRRQHALSCCVGSGSAKQLAGEAPELLRGA